MATAGRSDGLSMGADSGHDWRDWACGEPPQATIITGKGQVPLRPRAQVRREGAAAATEPLQPSGNADRLQHRQPDRTLGADEEMRQHGVDVVVVLLGAHLL